MFAEPTDPTHERSDQPDRDRRTTIEIPDSDRAGEVGSLAKAIDVLRGRSAEAARWPLRRSD